MRIRVVKVTYLDKEEINEYQLKCYPSTVDNLRTLSNANDSRVGKTYIIFPSDCFEGDGIYVLVEY